MFLGIYIKKVFFLNYLIDALDGSLRTQNMGRRENRVARMHGTRKELPGFSRFTPPHILEMLTVNYQKKSLTFKPKISKTIQRQKKSLRVEITQKQRATNMCTCRECVYHKSDHSAE